MPSAPNAPCVEVWLSPQTIVIPGCVKPELRPDDVDDALAAAPGRVERHTELGAVPRQRVELGLRERIGHRAAVGRDVVIHRRDRQVRTPHGPAREPQALERLRRRHLVDEVQVDEEERRLAGLFPDDVALPRPVEERARHCMQSTSGPAPARGVGPASEREPDPLGGVLSAAISPRVQARGVER